MLIVALELWGFEAINIMSGYLGVYQLGACSIVFNIIISLFMIALGMSFPTASLVGNSLGAGKPGNAIVYAKISIVIAIIVGVINFILILCFKSKLAYFFTNDDTIANMVIISLPFMALSCFGDYTHAVSAAIIRAMGYQKYLTISVLISYWLITLPLTYYFTFELNLDIKGIMLGLPVGLTILSIFSFLLIFTADFYKLSEEIVKKIQKEKQDLKK
mmetsp:Transcript_12174/g.10792  ORF Transcript_12174/g.10792 Transcript_12174/m.10792 type:complete len:217 (+) Transcript_12174:823-1473(+)